MIPLTVIDLGEDAIAAAVAVLRSGQLVQGEQVERFEAALAERTGRKHAIAVSSGTAALTLALQAVEVGAGDEVLCPALTWPSPAHAILAQGARPSLVDVDDRTWNVPAENFRNARGSRTRGAVVVEQFGNPSNHEAVGKALSGLPVVVDAACALGSDYHGTPCGKHGDIACLSFHPRKVLTTGEGGACLTDDDALAKRLRVLRNHGQSEPGRFQEPAGNYRMTEMAAALGLVQLQRLDRKLSRLRELGALYHSLLPDRELQEAEPGAVPNYQTMGVLLPGESDVGMREARIKELRAHGVGAGRLSYALHELPHLREAAEAARGAGRSLEVASDVADRGLALPMYEGMGDEDVSRVVDALHQVLVLGGQD